MSTDGSDSIELSLLRGFVATGGTAFLSRVSALAPIAKEVDVRASTRSCGTRTTWPMKPARLPGRPKRSVRGGSSSTPRSRAGSVTGRAFRPWPTRSPAIGIPAHLLHEVIDGVSMDVEPRRYATFADLAEYCHRVASVVGICCLHVWGYRSEEGRAEKLAEKCGIALQLTNIIRDVRATPATGGSTCPTEDLERFGVAPEDLIATGPPGEGLRALLAFQAQRAFEYYEAGRELVPLIASVGRPVFLTIVGTYRGLLDEIVSRNYNVLDGRISVSHWRKAAVVLRALAAGLTSRDAGHDSGRDERRYSESTIPLKCRSFRSPLLRMS